MSRSRINPWLLHAAFGGAAISRGTLPRFGGFGLLKTTADALSACPERMPDIEFSDSDDNVIAKTFEKLRDGYAVDRFLADPKMAYRLASACRKVGLTQPPSEICRRLLRLRKASGGGKLLPTTRKQPVVGLYDRLGPAVESAMVRMRIRHGSSVDDLLADVDLGAQFEKFARAIIDDGTPVEYRLCALQIRKQRHLSRTDQTLFDQLESDEITPEMIDLGPISRIGHARVPESPGIVLLADPEYPLLLSHFKSVRRGVLLLTSPRFVQGISAESDFWQLRPNETSVQYVAEAELPDGRVGTWERYLISRLSPMFNWPVKVDAA